MSLQKIVVLKLNDKRYLPTLPKNMQADNVRKLESEFKPKSRDVIRGLSPELERIVLPSYIGVQPEDVQFSHKTKEFWSDFSVTPSAEGIKLNIATEKKTVGEQQIEYPVNPEDYWVYQIAMQSSKVAKTAEDLKSLNSFDFYLVDLEAVEAKARQEFEGIEKADSEYVKLINAYDQNVDKIDWVIELLRDKTVSVDVESLEELPKKMLLRNIKEAQPLKFVDTLKDPKLETKATIIKCATYGVLTKEGNDYFYGEENIGNGKVAVSWFEKAENSQKILAIQSKLKAEVELKNNNR